MSTRLDGNIALVAGGVSQWAPVVETEVVWIEVDGEVIAIGPSGYDVHLISSTGALLWQLFDGEVTVEQLADDVSAVFDIDPGQAFVDVTEFVTDMVDKGLVAHRANDEQDAAG